MPPRKGSPRTPAQLAHDEQLKQIARDRNIAVAERRMNEEQPETIAEEDLLAQLGEALSTAGKTRGEQNRRLRQVEDLFTTLKPEDYPGLVGNPVVQRFVEMIAEKRASAATQIPPGSILMVGGIVGAQKKSWQWSDVQARVNSGEFTMVPFMSNTSEDLIWQGLKISVAAEQQIMVPNVFYEVWLEKRRGMFTAQQHAEWMFRKRDGFDARADPTVIGRASDLSSGSQFVRAMGQGNQGYHPGMGGFNMDEGPATEAEQ